MSDYQETIRKFLFRLTAIGYATKTLRPLFETSAKKIYINPFPEKRKKRKKNIYNIRTHNLLTQSLPHPKYIQTKNTNGLQDNPKQSKHREQLLHALLLHNRGIYLMHHQNSSLLLPFKEPTHSTHLIKNTQDKSTLSLQCHIHKKQTTRCSVIKHA